MYEWVKALHIISVIAWMAGLLYLPRLYVYHCAAEPGSELSETLKIMERRLLKAIMNPAMIASWVFGVWLSLLIEPWSDRWFHAQATLVVLLTASRYGDGKMAPGFRDGCQYQKPQILSHCQ